MKLQLPWRETFDPEVRSISTPQLCFGGMALYREAWAKTFPKRQESVYVDSLLPWGTAPFDKKTGGNFLSVYFGKPTTVTQVRRVNDCHGFPVAVFDYKN